MGSERIQIPTHPINPSNLILPQHHVIQHQTIPPPKLASHHHHHHHQTINVPTSIEEAPDESAEENQENDVINDEFPKNETLDADRIKTNEAEEIVQEKRPRGRPKKNEESGGNVFANFDPTAGLRKQTLRINPPPKKHWAP